MASVENNIGLFASLLVLTVYPGAGFRIRRQRNRIKTTEQAYRAGGSRNFGS